MAVVDNHAPPVSDGRTALALSVPAVEPVATLTKFPPLNADTLTLTVNPGPVPSPFLRSGIVAGSPVRTAARHRPLSGSAWALVNGAGGAVGVPSLGGSQTGIRLYLQGQEAPLALTARVSRALGRTRDTEVSAGYALRGRGVGLLFERRERLAAKDGAFAVTSYAGAYDVRLPADLSFDGFAQAGVAGIHSRRWFADGQARVTRRLSLSDRFHLGAGGGIWASAQTGSRRVEAGPLIEARVRIGPIGLRVAGEYRLRVTGDAFPRSGPALTIGADF